MEKVAERVSKKAASTKIILGNKSDHGVGSGQPPPLIRDEQF
jgi:hypothetical protein